jgi:hypothetical protein
VFSMWSVPRGYKRGKVWRLVERSRVKAGSNTSIVVLLVVEGDEMGTQCLGDIYTGTWPFTWGESRI